MERILLYLVILLILASTFAGPLFRWAYRSLVEKIRKRRSERIRIKPEESGLAATMSAVNRIFPQAAALVERGDPTPGTRVAEFDSANGYASGNPPPAPPRVSSSRGSALQRIRALPPLQQAIVWSELIGPPVADRDL